MGNRATIKAKGNSNKAVYLHWNGGRDSVEAFLKYCELRGFRGFDDDYGMARFCQVVGNFFGADGLSLGITDCTGSPGDNGVYVVDGWEVVDRLDFGGIEQRDYDLQEMLIEIDEAQPPSHQLGEYLKAEEVKTDSLKIGDKVHLMDFRGVVEIRTVVGLGEDRFLNGSKVLGVPYVDRYADKLGSHAENINNYILNDFVRLATAAREVAK